eukprot:5304041-Amphidinium_carterae.1
MAESGEFAKLATAFASADARQCCLLQHGRLFSLNSLRQKYAASVSDSHSPNRFTMMLTVV